MTTSDLFALTGILLGTLGFAVSIAWLIVQTWGRFEEQS